MIALRHLPTLLNVDVEEDSRRRGVKSLRASQMVYQVGAHPSFCSMKHWRQNSVEFVVDPRLCSEGFSRSSLAFVLSQKSALLNATSICKQWKNSLSLDLLLLIFYLLFNK